MTNTPTPAEIISRVKARYAGCRTYEDTVLTELVSATGPHPWKPLNRTFSFRVAFRPPTPMCFLKVESLRHDVAWTPNRPQEDYSTNARLEKDSKLNGHAWYGLVMGPLMIPHERTRERFLVEIPLTEVSSGQMDSRPCFVVTGRTDRHSREVWVDSDTSLLRRVRTCDRYGLTERVHMMTQMHTEMRDSRTARDAKIAIENALANLEQSVHLLAQDETITLRPRMDHDIDPRVFEFTPPT